MGFSSDGIPCSSGVTNMKELLTKTKNEYQKFNPKNKQWLCPFCITKSKTLVQCRIHIYKDHRNISEFDRFDFFSNLESTITQICTNVPLQDDHARRILDRKCKRKECPKTIENRSESDNETNEISNSSINRQKSSNDSRNENDAIFSCEFCPVDNPRKFKSFRGLKIHISKSHPDSTNDISEDKNIRSEIERLPLLKSNVRVLKRIPKSARPLAVLNWQTNAFQEMMFLLGKVSLRSHTNAFKCHRNQRN